MTTIIHNGWEFRALPNGQLECRNEKKGLDWALRKPSDIDYLDGHFALLWDGLNTLSYELPREGEELPKAEPLKVYTGEEQNVAM